MTQIKINVTPIIKGGGYEIEAIDHDRKLIVHYFAKDEGQLKIMCMPDYVQKAIPNPFELSEEIWLTSLSLYTVDFRISYFCYMVSPSVSAISVKSRSQ